MTAPVDRMPVVDVIVPTFRRPDRLAGVAANVHEATPVRHVVSFVVEEDDQPSLEAAKALVCAEVRVVVNDRAHNYSGALNAAVASSCAPFWFAASDDLRFRPGWFETARAMIDDQFWVVGTNDLLNTFVLQGLHATHYLVDRRYTDEVGGTVDGGPGTALHEGYDHNYCDTEFIGTAKARVRFRPCLDSVVEHMHWTVRKGPKDATSERAYRHFQRDRQLYDARRPMWQELSL